MSTPCGRNGMVRTLQRPMPDRAFTLIEVLVVVAIIALLISILMPSLRAAREAARASVGAVNMRTVMTAGTTWLLDTRKEAVPAYRGWVAHVLRAASWQTEIFTCPSDQSPSPIVPIMIAQTRTGYKYPTVSTDSAYFRRNPSPDTDGFYRLDFETEADIAGGDRDFNDAYVYLKPQGKQTEYYVQKKSTGRALHLLNMRGQTLISDFTTTPHLQAPVLWGSFAMNLSAGIPGHKPWHLFYAEYDDWSAVTEGKLGVASTSGSSSRADRQDKTNILKGLKGGPWVKFHHNGKANIGFFDTHVELTGPEKLKVPDDQRLGSIWHPERPTNWSPPLFTN